MISVCVATHDRPLRLRWLLDALAAQDGVDFEVVVGHDGDDATEAIVASHPVVARHVRLAPGTGTPGANRNAAVALARGELVAFTDDDCRPASGWLAALAAEAREWAVLQGSTRPDPDELGLVALRGRRTQDIAPPTPWGQACNIAYPRALLERLGGFDEALHGGEDCDLLRRALAAGAEHVAVPDALVWHAVEVTGAPARARLARRWRHLPDVVRRHPHLREHLVLRVFLTRRRAWFWLAVLGLATRRRLLVLPWARTALPSYGPHRNGRLRAVAELPLELLDDAVEAAWVLRGAVEHRSPVL